MFITQEEADRRLQSSKNLKNTITSERPQNIKTFPVPVDNSPVDISIAKKKIIAMSLVAQGVSEQEVSSQLNISIAQMHDLNAEDKVSVKSSIDRIRELALDRMMIALGLMTPEKFENASLKELSNACAQLSKVISYTGDKTSVVEDNRVQFIVHAPHTRSISDFQIVDV